MKYYGMDISSLQGIVNNSIKDKNIDFVMLKSTYGCYGIDPRFDENAKKLNDLKIPIGVYHCLQADNTSESILEAKHCLSKISKFKIEYPVALITDEINFQNIEKNKVIEIIKAFLSTIKDMNFYPMLFVSDDKSKRIDLNQINNIDIWIKSFENKPECIKNLSMWQYTNSGDIKNFGNNINLDISYENYKEKIKKLNMNILNGGLGTLENMTDNNTQNNSNMQPQASVSPSTSMELYSNNNIMNGNNNYYQESNDLKPVVYTVKSGDTLWGISQTYLGSGQKYYEIQSLNHLSNDTIHPGQTLLIPQNLMSGWILYNVVSGDTLWNLARKYLGSWTKYNYIMNLNNLENETIYPGQILKIPLKGKDNVYVVQTGDNLWNIALKLLGDGNRYYEIISLNNLGTSPIVPGQQLKIPEF